MLFLTSRAAHGGPPGKVLEAFCKTRAVVPGGALASAWNTVNHGENRICQEGAHRPGEVPVARLHPHRQSKHTHFLHGQWENRPSFLQVGSPWRCSGLGVSCTVVPDDPLHRHAHRDRVRRCPHLLGCDVLVDLGYLLRNRLRGSRELLRGASVRSATPPMAAPPVARWACTTRSSSSLGSRWVRRFPVRRSLVELSGQQLRRSHRRQRRGHRYQPADLHRSVRQRRVSVHRLEDQTAYQQASLLNISAGLVNNAGFIGGTLVSTTEVAQGLPTSSAY